MAKVAEIRDFAESPNGQALVVSIPDPVDLNEHAEALPDEALPESSVSHPLLREILDNIEPLDFRERLELPDGENLKLKHVFVLVVEEVLNVARRLNCGLCRKADFIYLFNGEYWQQIQRDDLKTFLGEAAEKMSFDRWEARYFENREKLFKQFLSDASLPDLKQSGDRVLINLKNGTFEVNAGKGGIRDFNRQDFLTYQLPFEFEPSADCPKFRQFLDRVLPDANVQKVLAEFFGYVFTRHLKLEKCLLAYGSGANGKSVLFDVVNAIFGRENISNFSLSNLREEHNRALIADKLLNYGSEIKGNIEADDFKLMVSGEPIQARLKYGNSFFLTNHAKFAFNCNTLPKDVEHTEAYFRRFLIVPFEVTISESERNPNLAKEIIREELAGVFIWILEGLNRLLEQGDFTQCEKVSQAVSRFKQENDSVFLWLEENQYRRSVQQFQPLSTLFQDYRNFCHQDGYRALGKKNFSDRLKNNGFDVGRGNGGVTGAWIEKIA